MTDSDDRLIDDDELDNCDRLNSNDRLIPDPKICKRYDITAMTLWRWDRDPLLGFPGPVWIRRRKYRRLSQLQAWEREQAKKKSATA